MNVAQASVENKVKSYCLVLKAVSPKLYGATKLCSDKLLLVQTIIMESSQFSVVRYKCVSKPRFCSAIFKSIDKNKEFPITDKKIQDLILF